MQTTISRRFDHIDLRVPSLAVARPFYAVLLPALSLRHAGGRNIEGPGYDEGPGYYAVFFEDPCRNRLEICHRIPTDDTKGDAQAAP